MKHSFRKTVIWALAVMLAFSCVGLTSFAATKDNVTQFGKEGGYLAIGDSIGKGCGSVGEANGYEDYNMRNPEGAYPTQVAEALGCLMPDDNKDQNATYWACCFPGLTTAITLDLFGIDDNFSDTAIDYPYYDEVLRYFGTPSSFEGTRGYKYVEGECGLSGDILEIAKKVDVISVELGMCDVFYRAYRIASHGGFLADGISLDISDPAGLVDIVKTAIGLMNEGYDYWASHYTMLIEKLQELNPDAIIVMVGSFNLVDNLTITDETAFPLGKIINAYTDRMNKQYEEWAKQYNVLYADIANCETLATENDWSLLGDFKEDSFHASHPSQIGHDYIARQILSVLPPVEEHHNIHVDLVRYDKVDHVLINGIPVKNYTLNGYDLDIDYAGPGALNMVIAVVNDDVTIAFQTYDLDFSIRDGYTVHRVYGNNDAKEHASRPFNLIIKLFKLIIEKIKGLFSR